jgi:hypothetical protein
MSEEEAKEEWKKLDAEMCKMNTWSDQIEYGIIKCAECNKTICDCDIHLFDEINGGVSPKKKNTLEEILKEKEEVDSIMREYFLHTGFSLSRDEVEDRVRKEKEKQEGSII